MTVATLLFTVALVWIIGDLMIAQLSTSTLMLSTMLIASIVASSAAIAGDVMQDTKTGHVGATPRIQQTAEIIGVITGALVIGPTTNYYSASG